MRSLFSQRTAVILRTTAKDFLIHPNAKSIEDPMPMQRTPPSAVLELSTDFSELARKYPSLQPFLKTLSKDTGSGYCCTLDFRNPLALQTLSAAILSIDFGIYNWALPSDRLCPPIPSRFEYLCWIKHLLALHVSSSTDSSAEAPHSASSTAAKAITGLDVGTGCSCVYPLLGASAFGWHFVASDVDPTACTWATRNVEKAGFSDYISVRLVQSMNSGSDVHASNGNVSRCTSTTDDCSSSIINGSSGNGSDSDNSSGGPLSTALLESDGALDFCMCNPPFFATAEEAVRAHPLRSCPGAAGELWCPGGEVAFVSAIIDDSVRVFLHLSSLH